VKEYSEIGDIIKESRLKIDESENVDDSDDSQECIVRQLKPKKGIKENKLFSTNDPMIR
jgi:hypothetical protein